VAETYYARRSARDPAWREQAIRSAAERKRRRLQLGPEAARAAHREAMRRYRARLRAQGLTFEQMLTRVGGDREMLAHIIRDEQRLGRVHLAAGRYVLNGQLPADVRQALIDLHL
jgi:hypothetical protein